MAPRPQAAAPSPTKRRSILYKKKVKVRPMARKKAGATREGLNIILVGCGKVGVSLVETPFCIV